MTSYHDGELAVQARVGVKEEADRLGRGIGGIVKPAAREFLQGQSLAIASTIDKSDRVWASLLVGEAGFIEVLTEQKVKINPYRITGDSLEKNLLQQKAIGILVIDLATRRRLRINGWGKLLSDGGIEIETQQVYFNCPKYIQVRYLDTDKGKSEAASEIKQTDTLSTDAQNWIVNADTFFIASYEPETLPDISHRGGYPGFVRVVNAKRLVFPDYSGNNMFNTLGNIAVNPQAGLLFIDFEQGHTLQMIGKAKIIWDAEKIATFSGAERLLQFDIDRIIEVKNATSRRWHFKEYSPYNPV